MSIPELEIALQKALERWKNAMEAPAPEPKGDDWKEILSVGEAVLQAERALAAAKGEPYAVAIDFPVSWNAGAPLPHLLQSDDQTFLIFLLRNFRPRSDASQINALDPDAPARDNLAVVEFEGCACAKMGTPNDEVFHGHSLHGKGLVGYRALVVENSSWLKELEAINAVHSCYEPKFWRELKHYIFPFHDSTFECAARAFKVETYNTSLSQLLADICQRLVK